MYAYELLPRLKYLLLDGQDEDGELTWIGTEAQWHLVNVMEMSLWDD